MRFYIKLFLFFFSITLFAQEQIVDTTAYTFINYDLNRITNGKNNLYSFFEKLYLLENNEINKVSIFHFGDSHVAGLSFPNRLEYLFQLNFGNLGRMVHTEQPKVKKRYAKRRRRRGGDIDDFSTEFAAIKDTLFTPDSLVIDTDTSWLSLVPVNKSGIYFNIYGNVGKSFPFFTSSSFFMTQLEAANPDLAVITLGTNDAFAPKFDSLLFYNNAKELITALKRSNPKVNIILTIPSESYIKRKTINANIEVVKNAIILLAEQEKVCAWDFYDIMAYDDKMNNWVVSGLATNDKVHFTKQGYTLMADLLYVAIMKEYESFLLEKNNFRR